VQRSRTRSRLWRAVATVVTGALVASAAAIGIAAPAQAAGAAVSVPEVPRAGGTVTITGSGFDVSGFGLYLGVRANDAGSDTYTVWIDDTNTTGDTAEGPTGAATPDGSFTVDVPVPAYSEVGYSIVTRGAHGIPNATNETTTPVVYAAPVAAATTTTLDVSPAGTSEEGTDVVLTATVSPAVAGSVDFYAAPAGGGSPTPLEEDVAVVDGVAGLTVADLPVGTHRLTATFTPSDTVAYAPSTSTAVTHEVTAAPTEPETPTPTLVVSQATGLDPDGVTITVTGAGYDTTARALYGPGAGVDAAGVYAQVGWLAPSWRPSEGAASSDRSNAASVWVQGTNGTSPYLLWTDNGDGTASFSWTVTIDKASLDAVKIAGGTLSVFTVGAGGVTQAVNEKAVSLTFTDPVVTVSDTTFAPGEPITVSGVGFPAGQVATIEIHSDPIVLGTATVSGTGGFTFTGTIPVGIEPGTHSIVVTAGGVSVELPGGVTITSDPVATAADTAVVCTANSVSAATVNWGFKRSFVDYINGGIANGSVSGGWGTGSGAYSVENNSGSVRYNGSVTYYGHSGVLDITLSNLRIAVRSATTAVLFVTTPSTGEIPLANLSLPAASTSGGAISWSNASATITSAGSQLFSYNGNAFYPTGTALDPVSFSFPLGASVPCDSTTDGTLAATGGSAPIEGLWIGMGALLLGLGALAIRRRRTAKA